ncbi:hypothetical protein GOODEAATRI_031083, partial [Goodea atripinnis]
LVPLGLPPQQPVPFSNEAKLLARERRRRELRSQPLETRKPSHCRLEAGAGLQHLYRIQKDLVGHEPEVLLRGDPGYEDRGSLLSLLLTVHFSVLRGTTISCAPGVRLLALDTIGPPRAASCVLGSWFTTLEGGKLCPRLALIIFALKGTNFTDLH